MRKRLANLLLISVFSFSVLLTGCTKTTEQPIATNETATEVNEMAGSLEELIAQYEDGAGVHTDLTEELDLPTLDDIPEYSGYAYVEINNNVPYISISEPKDGKPYANFELYSPLDNLGRCTSTFVCMSKKNMPTEERGPIGSVKPSGWHTIKYNDLIDGNYLYNRCHLIGYQLTGENANEKNLITGTRYLNVIGMLPFENALADYMEQNPENHVLYRVEPMFDGDNLVANGVLMQAKSLEDNGEGIQFCVFCYNVQPGIEIDYATGDSKENPEIIAYDYTYDEANASTDADEEIAENVIDSEDILDTEEVYIVNGKNGTIHTFDCPNLPAKENRHIYNTYEEAAKESINLAGEEKLCGNCMR